MVNRGRDSGQDEEYSYFRFHYGRCSGFSLRKGKVFDWSPSVTAYRWEKGNNHPGGGNDSQGLKFSPREAPCVENQSGGIADRDRGE